MRFFTVREIADPKEKQKITRRVLEALPDWFGNEPAREDYITKSAGAPFAAAFLGDEPIGMLALKTTSPYAMEIMVMGVLPENHRSGAGRALMDWAKNYAKNRGYEYLHLKTLDESANYPPYEITRAFYRAVGFQELMCLPTLWDAENPCLIMIQKL